MAKFNNNSGNNGKPSGPKKGQVAKKHAEVIEINEPRCKVCQNEYRHQMEAMMVRGHSLSSVARFFEQLGVDVNRKNLATHRDNHMALEKAAIAGVINQRWREQVVDPDAVEGEVSFIMTKHGLLDAMLHKAWQKIENDEAEWKPTDVIQIMTYMERLEAQQKNVALDQLMMEARAFRDAVKAVVPQNNWEEIVHRFEQNVDIAQHPIRAIETTAEEEDG